MCSEIFDVDLHIQISIFSEDIVQLPFEIRFLSF